MLDQASLASYLCWTRMRPEVRCSFSSFQVLLMLLHPKTARRHPCTWTSSSLEGKCSERTTTLKFDVVVGKKGKHIATSIHVAPCGTLNIFTIGDKNALSYTSVSNTPARQTSRNPVVKANGRQGNVGSDHLSKVSGACEARRSHSFQWSTNMFAFRKATEKDVKENWWTRQTLLIRTESPIRQQKGKPARTPTTMARKIRLCGALSAIL